MKIVVDGIALEAERNAVASPRAIVLALHGGGYDARYWHHPGAPDASLLTLGEALGFDVLAVDRPGNARSGADGPFGMALDAQADFLHRLIAQERAGPDQPVFVIGHSLGGVMALMLAAHPRGKALAGIEVSGVPMDFGADHAAMGRALIATAQAGGEAWMPVAPREPREAMFFGPAGAYDPAVVAWGETEHPVPGVEVAEVFGFPDRKADICGRITIPAQITVAEHERSSLVDAGSVDRIAALFAHNPDARVLVQRHSGHNISLHHVGRAYHLRALAFFEDCMAMRQAG
jgi:pimeloyl-ACP methyl ester carboxylesterase